MSEDNTQNRFVVLIVGGGTAGVSVAAGLLKAQPDLNVAIVEPSDKHYYQPGWTLVGGGAMNPSVTERDFETLLPKGAKWIKAAATTFDPEQNQVKLDNGLTLHYRYLVVAAGLQIDWHKVDGLSDTLGKNGVTSNYRFDLAPYTWQLTQKLAGGKALFTQPPMPIKCAGAPQKAMYLSSDHWRNHKIDVDVHFYNAGAGMFGVPAYANALNDVVSDYGVNTHFGHNLIAVDGDKKLATFSSADSGEIITESFDMLHVVPPQSAPEFIKQSPISGADGWVPVDKHSLVHDVYNNIYALGDCCNTANAKTAAAIRRQFPVVVDGLLQKLDIQHSGQSYDGYGACPLTVSHKKVLLAEFRYDGEIVPSFPLNPTVPRRLHWILKRYFFPWLYWNVLLKGKDWNKPAAKPRPHLLPK